MGGIQNKIMSPFNSSSWRALWSQCIFCFGTKGLLGSNGQDWQKSVSSTHNMIFCWPLNWIGEVAKPFTQMPPMMNVLKMSITYSIREFLRRPQKEHHAGLGPSLLFSMVMVVCSPPRLLLTQKSFCFTTMAPTMAKNALLHFLTNAVGTCKRDT